MLRSYQALESSRSCLFRTHKNCLLSTAKKDMVHPEICSPHLQRSRHAPRNVLSTHWKSPCYIDCWMFPIRRFLAFWAMCGNSEALTRGVVCSKQEWYGGVPGASPVASHVLNINNLPFLPREDVWYELELLRRIHTHSSSNRMCWTTWSQTSC